MDPGSDDPAPRRGRSPEGAQEDVLDAVWLALEDGRSGEALGLLESVDFARGERHAAEVYARLERGDWSRAEAALARAAARLPEDDMLLAAARAEWHLVHWRVEEAQALFERAARGEPDPALLERLALCADLTGDFARADRLQAECAALDPDGSPPPPRLTPEAFEEVVARAADELPEEFRDALEEIPVVIDPMPGRDLVEGGDVHELPPDLLGLFVGRSALERSVESSAELPPTIFLFQRNLERACLDVETLQEEIRVTLYHELAHALGFDEDGVEAMGLE